ncbi:MAG: sigma-70 family RNA polymerase sigma factor [Polyangiales bacterium]
MQSNAGEALALEGDVVRDFDQIYRENVTYVLGLLRRFGATRAQAEDLAHDVFETTFYKLAALPPEDRASLGRMRAYLFQVTWQRLANHRRLHSVRRERPDGDGAEHGVGPRAHDYVLAREVARYLDALDPVSVAIFVGFEVFGATVPELAEEHQMTEAEARAVLHHARAKLRRSIPPPPAGESP